MAHHRNDARRSVALSMTIPSGAQPSPMGGPGYRTPGAEVRHTASSLFEPAWDDAIFGAGTRCDCGSTELPRHLAFASDDLPQPRFVADAFEEEAEEDDLLDEDEDDLEDDEEEDEVFPDDPEEDEDRPEQDDTDDDDLPDDDADS